MFKSSGILTYYPNWWAVIYVCEDIAKYYSKMVYMNSFLKLNKTKYKPHISVIYKEEPQEQYKNKWGYNDGEEIEFLYDGFVRHDENGVGFWLNVECRDIEKIRQTFGLPSLLYAPHITIGNLK